MKTYKTYISDLTSKPDWLGTYGDQTGKTLNTDFGFGPDGMYFVGNAGNEGPSTAYSVRTNWDISGRQACEVIFTVDHTGDCTDQGICFYNDGQSPNWNWNPDPSRIAFSVNCPTLYIYGTNKFVNNSGEYYGNWGEGDSGSNVLGSGLYTFKVTYNPTAGTVTAVTYEGSNTSGAVLDNIVLYQKLSDSSYRIGFDADNDGLGADSFPAYFKSLQINVDDAYEVDLSPDHPETIPNYKYDGDGNLDTAIVESSGKRISIQRTSYLELIDIYGNRKVVSSKDGGSLGIVSDNFLIEQEYFNRPPVSQSINYTQSSLYDPRMAIATKETMINGSAAESRATGTVCGGFEYIQIDLNGVYNVKGVVIGCDWFGPNQSDPFDTNLPGLIGDWGKEYTENKNVEYSTDGINYTFLFNTGTFEQPIQTYNVNIKTRYIRIVDATGSCLSLTEFYAI